MKHRRYAICIFMLCFFFVNSLPIRANSAATFWHGTSSTGVISGDRDCPVEVESEILRLQIPEFPHSYYETADAFLSYSAYVEATYSLYNPTDYEVTFRLFSPSEPLLLIIFLPLESPRRSPTPMIRINSPLL